MNRTTLLYKSEKKKTQNKKQKKIGHLIHCSKCTQTQTYTGCYGGWQLCKHLLSLPVKGSWGVKVQLNR